jgi:hypothetical protein
MRRLAALVLAASLISPAFASEEKAEHGAEAPKSDGKDDEKGKKEDREPGTTVEMPFLIAPLIQDGRLVAYAYISSKLQTSSLAAAVAVRGKTPFLQDAFVRNVNGAPIGKPDDPLTVDEKALAARLLADAKRIAGSKQAVNLVLTKVQVESTRPDNK